MFDRYVGHEFRPIWYMICCLNKSDIDHQRPLEQFM